MKKYLLAALPFLLFGCARRELIRPPRTYEIVEEILRSLQEEGERLESVKAFGSLTGTEEGKGYFANFVLLYKKPGLLRLDLTGPFGLAMMNMVSDGRTVQVYYPQEGELLEGELKTLLSFDVEPGEIEKLILGTVEPPPGIHSAAIFSRGESYILEGPKGSWELEVDRTNLRVIRFLRSSNKGSVLELKLSQYRRVGRLLRPFRIEISQPEERKRLRIDCTHQIPNEHIKEEAFQLTVPERN